jgi:hypothetical protein
MTGAELDMHLLTSQSANKAQRLTGARGKHWIIKGPKRKCRINRNGKIVPTWSVDYAFAARLFPQELGAGDQESLFEEEKQETVSKTNYIPPAGSAIGPGAMVDKVAEVVDPSRDPDSIAEVAAEKILLYAVMNKRPESQQEIQDYVSAVKAVVWRAVTGRLVL